MFLEFFVQYSIGNPVGHWCRTCGSDNAILTSQFAGYSANGKANGATISVQAVSQYFDLGLDEWHSSDVPQFHNVIDTLPNSSAINNAERADSEYILATVNLGYDIADFEILRGSYATRRELPCFFIEKHISVTKQQRYFQTLDLH